MSVHYKFKSALEYDTVTFDGLHISVKDLKKAIIHQKRIGKNTDFDLQVTNAQTKEVYTDENALIPKNTSLVIARIPLVSQAKTKAWEGYGAQGGAQPAAGAARPEDGVLSKAVDLTQLDASEDDKIRAMMTQSTLDYDPSNYMKIRGSNQVGVVPAHYRCFKCHQPGHWIKDCPLGHGQEPMEIKKSTGIPRSFMVPVEGPMVPGAMMTPTGQYAVPVLDHQAYNESHKVPAVTQEEKPEIPEDLLCSICKDLLTDAVMIPCCGNSFCDECIRTVLLESEDHECPDCHEKDISPGTLIPNRFLRNSVSNFKNETGYHKRQQYRNAINRDPPPAAQEPAQQTTDTKPVVKEAVVQSAESTTTESQAAAMAENQEQAKPDSPVADDVSREPQKPIISEADSTETAKATVLIKEEIVPEKSTTPPPPLPPPADGPPGVESPTEEVAPAVTEIEAPPGVDVPPAEVTLTTTAPTVTVAKQGQAITSVGGAVNHHKVSHVSQNSSSSRIQQNIDHHIQSRHYTPQIPPTYTDTSAMEERPGTPTVDEPGVGPPGYTGTDTNSYTDAPPPGLLPTTTTLPPSQHMHPPPRLQGPPPTALPVNTGPYTMPPVSTHQPPPNHYPTTNPPPQAGYRLPPPGHPDFGRVGPNSGYGDLVHPRVLLVTSVDPSVPPPTVAPSQGTFAPRPLYDPTRPPYDPHRPPLHTNPAPTTYPAYTAGPRVGNRPYAPPRHMQPPPPGLSHRLPSHPVTNVIDDPLEAFNRMLREKDERDRRARQRRLTRSRSYSRSRSSSRSFSRSPRSRSRTPPRHRSRHRSRTRSPPPRSRRTPRSRSRSFSISRSRSFSRSPSFRGSPVRDYSPRRRPPSRYRSPLTRATPPRYRYKDTRPLLPDRERDRLERDRMDRERGGERDREYPYYEGGPPPAQPAPVPGPVDYDYDNGYESGRPARSRPPLLRNPRYGLQPTAVRKDYPLADPYYPAPDLCPPASYPPPHNRYNVRGSNYPPPLMSVKTVPPHGLLDRGEPIGHRKYEDVPPPGIEQPPVPGFENQRYDSRYPPPYDRSRDDGPPGVDRYPRASPYQERDDHREPDRMRSDMGRDYRDKPRDTGLEEKERFDRKYSPSPERDRRQKSLSPRRTSRDRFATPDKNRRRKREDSPDRDKNIGSSSRNESDRDKRDKKKDTSEDEKSKKSRDKKKKKERREAERKKKKEKREKKEQEKLKKAEEKKSKEVHETNTEEKKPEPEPEKEHKETPKPAKAEVLSDKETEKKSRQESHKPEEPEVKPKIDLYDDLLAENIDSTVVENYGKIDTKKEEQISSQSETRKVTLKDELDKSNEGDSEEKDTSFDGLELQANEAELKGDFLETKSKTNEVLAPVPEPSKWELDDDTPTTPEKNPTLESKVELKQVFDRPNKVVTSEVLKRAENAIFAKAINAIRPIEIKKISLDRAKLYSGEKQGSEIISKDSMKNVQVTFVSNSQWNLEDIPPPGTEPIKLKLDKPTKTSPPPSRLSVKERLGCKVEELDKISKEDKPFDRNRSRSLSPLSKRNEESSRNVSIGERRIELDDRRRDEYRRQDDRSRHDSRSRHESRRHDREYDKDRRYRSSSRGRDGKSSYRDRRTNDRKDYRRDDRRERDDRRTERSRSRHRTDRRHDHREDRHREEKREGREPEREKRNSRSRRSKSHSETRDHKDRRKKSRDKKHKKEKDKEKDKGKKHKKSEDESDEVKQPEVKIESKVSEKKHENPEPKLVSEKYEKAKAVDERRKPTLDEASFEPDYDLETESEKEETKVKVDIPKKRDRSKSNDSKITQEMLKKRKVEETDRKSPKESSSSDSSDSSSDEGRHKKRHRKHKKKKSRKDSSSSSSSSDSDTSTDRKSKKRHKSGRKIKKKKKSKHK